MHTAAGIWPDCWLETNPLCWLQTVGRCWEITFSRIGFSVAADIDSNVVDIYALVWSLSRLLCCVGSGSSVATALCPVSGGVTVGETSYRKCRIDNNLKKMQ
jgi:hypothetical protein